MKANLSSGLRLFSVLIVPFLIIGLWPGGVDPPSAKASSCEFVLGFKALHDLVPEVVGECRTNVQYNSENGDALQNTAGGLLVWRKADNFTAFTDGYRSWVNGPNGLEQRLNTERFLWEAGAGEPGGGTDVNSLPITPIQKLLDLCKDKGASFPKGERVRTRGYLTFPEGGYMIGDTSYTISLKATADFKDFNWITVVLRGGNQPNSMYFDDAGIPQINDAQGAMIPFPRLSTVEGTWLDRCLLKVEAME